MPPDKWNLPKKKKIQSNKNQMNSLELKKYKNWNQELIG